MFITIQLPFFNVALYICFVSSDNSDLNLRVDEAGVKGTPITAEGFAFMWAGVRASYGVTKGKVCFEIKVRVECHDYPNCFVSVYHQEDML